jgi:hypothetical protein
MRSHAGSNDTSVELEFKNSTQVSQYFRRQIIASQDKRRTKLVPCLLSLVDDARGIVHQNVDLAGGRGLYTTVQCFMLDEVFYQVYDCLFLLGWPSNFVGSESGQIQSVKLLQNMVSNRTQHPHPLPAQPLTVL